MRRYHYYHVYTLLLLFALVLSGCPAISGKYTRVEYNYKVGSTHVAVTSVTPWEEVVSELQPRYKMDAEKALEESIPTTTRYEQIISDAVRAKLDISFPAASKPQPSDAKDTSTDSEKKEKKEASSAGSGATSPSQSSENKKPGVVSADKPKVEGLGRDPMIKYHTAISLFQELQLLNRYLHDAATRSKYRAYVVRLQVSLMPAARNMPYDAYLNISFLTMPYGKLKEKKVPLNTYWRDPIIVPLLVTDDIEAMASSRSLQSIRQLGLGLMAMLQGIGAKVDFQTSSDNLQKISGEDFNSLLSVARVSDNTIRVRLGAMHQANSHYVAVPRTHNISVLLLVPEEYVEKDEKIYIDSLTSFGDSASGKMLRNTEGNIQVRQEISGLLRDYKFSDTENNADLVEMMIWDLLMNRFDKFVQRYEQLEPRKAYTELDNVRVTDFYLGVGDLAVGSVTTYTSFSLPDGSHCMPKQTALLIDNGDKTTAFLNGNCDNYTKSIKKAFLKVIDKRNRSEDIFPLEDFSFSNTWCEKVNLIFPSLAAMNYQGLGSNDTGNIELYFELKKGKTECGEDSPVKFNTRYVLKKEDKTKPPTSQTAAAETPTPAAQTKSRK